MHAKIPRLNKLLIYLVIAGLPFYYFFREYGSLASLIYSIALILLFFKSFFSECQRYWNKKNIFQIDFILEILIIFNIFLVTVYLNLFDRNLILLFVILLIAKNLSRFEFKDNLMASSNALTLSALIGAIGVIAGYIESIFYKTQIFNQVMDFDYPYSDGLSATTLLNGFFASANGSAYCICAGLAFSQYQNLIKGNLKNILCLFLGLTLLLTKAKFAFLYSFMILGMYLLKNFSKKYVILFICTLGLSYIFLSHIMIALSGSYDYPSLHFRKLLFSLGPIDFILGNYGMFKVFALEAIISNTFFPIGLSQFEEIYNGRPHFMFGNLIISGGMSLAILITTYLLIFIKNNAKDFVKLLNHHYLYVASFFCFLIESINWSFGNSIYFWMVVFSLSSVRTLQIKNLMR